MRLNFSYTLLITWLLFTVSCKTNFIPTNSNSINISVSDDINGSDSALIEIVQPFKEILGKDMKRIISVSEKEMVKGRPESELTNFLADILLEEARIVSENEKLNVTPAVSYFNYGGIRTSIPKGEINVGKIFELMPFENEMVFLQLTGNQIHEFLNYIAKNGGGSVGGVRFVISNEKAENIRVNNSNLDAGKKYWLVTNDYVAQGGDGLSILTQGSDMIKSGKKIRDLIILNLEKRHKTGELISVELDGRIINE